MQVLSVIYSVKILKVTNSCSPHLCYRQKKVVYSTMGKVRRVRQKLHLAAPKESKSNEIQETAVPSQVSGKSPLLKTEEELSIVPDNLFKGIDINFEELNKKLIEDDRVSVQSVAKLCKYDNNGKLLTKKEKQKIKHDLFMRSKYHFRCVYLAYYLLIKR